MNVELKSGIEAVRLLRRNPGKYCNRVKGLYVLSIADCELGQVARSSYFFLREVDDLLDGDRYSVDDPLQHVLDLRSQVATGNFNASQSISNLAKFSIKTLKRKAKPFDNPTGNFLEAIDCMIFDYDRSKERKTLSENELSDYYLNAFLPVLNLMLIGLGSSLRAIDLTRLALAQGAIYSTRDLGNDWPKGIINIPSEVLTAASLSPLSGLQEIQSSPIINNYLSSQLIKSRAYLEEADQELAANPEWLTRKVIRGLIKPMYKFIDKRLKTTNTPNN